MSRPNDLPTLPFAVPPFDWRELTPEQRLRSWQAATGLIAQMSALSERGTQAVQAVIGDAVFTEWDHYPFDDVSDKRRASQYFYHAHPGLQRPFTEHGHFHLFVHAHKLGLARTSDRYRPAPAHLLAISMDAQGLPIGLFTVNRWVTKGPWLKAGQVLDVLDRFAVKSKEGVPEVNGMLSAIVKLYRPQIERLLEARDQALALHGAGRDRRRVFADPQIEVLSFHAIDLVADIEALEQLVG
jgi:hypothetical protein